MSIRAGVAFVDILPNMKAFGASLVKGVNEEQKRTAAKVGKIGLAMGAGLALGAGRAVKQATDLGEGLNALRETFQDQADQVIAWSKNQNDAFDQIDFNAKIKDMASFGRAAGLTGGDLASFAKETLDAAQDLASFHNVDAAQVIEDLGFAMQGTAQPVRRYGILIDQQVIKAKAMSEGLVKAEKNQTAIKSSLVAVEVAQRRYTEAIKEHGKGSLEARSAEAGLLTAKEKLGREMKGQVPQLDAQTTVLATQKFILDQLGPAAGDWARTLKSPANQQRVMAANVKDLTTALGEGLLPAFAQLIKLGNIFTSFFGDNIGVAKALVGVIASLTAAMLIYSGTVKVVTAVQMVYNTVFKATNATMKANPIGLIVTALALLVIGLITAYQKSETFRKIVDGAFHGVQKTVDFVVKFIRNHWKLLLTILLIPVAPLLLVVLHFKKIKSTVTNVVDWIREKWNKLPGVIRLLINPIERIRFILGLMRATVLFTVDFFADKWQTVIDKIQATINKIRDLIRKIREMWDKAKGWLGDLKGWFDKLVPDISFNVRPSGDGVLGAAANPGGLVNRILPFLGLAQSMGLSLTSGYRPGAITSTGNVSLHSLGRAIDVAGSPQQMISFYRRMVGMPGIAELLYSPIGGWYGSGGIVPLVGSVLRDHFDHVHVGIYDKGGYLPEGWSIAGNFTGRPEPIGHQLTEAGKKMKLTITNWDEGTGYFELVADGAVTGNTRLDRQKRRMKR
jgi:hypothetical protein